MNANDNQTKVFHLFSPIYAMIREFISRCEAAVPNPDHFDAVYDEVFEILDRKGVHEKTASGDITFSSDEFNFVLALLVMYEEQDISQYSKIGWLEDLEYLQNLEEKMFHWAREQQIVEENEPEEELSSDEHGDIKA